MSVIIDLSEWDSSGCPPCQQLTIDTNTRPIMRSRCDVISRYASGYGPNFQWVADPNLPCVGSYGDAPPHDCGSLTIDPGNTGCKAVISYSACGYWEFTVS